MEHFSNTIAQRIWVNNELKKENVDTNNLYSTFLIHSSMFKKYRRSNLIELDNLSPTLLKGIFKVPDSNKNYELFKELSNRNIFSLNLCIPKKFRHNLKSLKERSLEAYKELKAKAKVSSSDWKLSHQNYVSIPCNNEFAFWLEIRYFKDSKVKKQRIKIDRFLAAKILAIAEERTANIIKDIEREIALNNINKNEAHFRKMKLEIFKEIIKNLNPSIVINFFLGIDKKKIKYLVSNETILESKEQIKNYDPDSSDNEDLDSLLNDLANNW